MDERRSLDDLKAALANNAEALAVDLFGTDYSRTRNDMRWGRKGSLQVTLAGKHPGTFRSWEDDRGGSMLDAIAFAHDCSIADAIQWARRWMGDDPVPLPKRRKPVIDPVVEEKRRIDVVQQIWRETTPIDGTPGETYLRSRAITPDAWPESIRWHRDGYLVFACTSPKNETTAIQRIYVRPDGTPKLDDGKKIKRSLGPRYSGAVHFPGDPSCPLCIAEGPETALSVWLATGYETWAALGQIGGVSLKQVPLDRTIIVCKDDDAHIAPSKKAIRDTIRKWRREGRTVLDVLPWERSRRDKSDFNDSLQKHGAEYVRDRIEAVLNRTSTSHLDELPILEARKKLSREIHDAVEDLFQRHAEQPVNVLKVGIGIGKTEEGISAAIRWIKQGRGDVVYAVPTHHLSSEVLGRIQSKAKGKIRVAVWRGREAVDPEFDGERMCRDLDAVKDVQKVGGDPQELVCAKGGLQCPFFDDCGYQRQRKQEADLWIVAHASLFSQKPGAIPSPSLLIIDEAFWQQGIRGTGNEKAVISESDLAATPYAASMGKTADIEVELMPIRRKLIEAIDGKDGPVRSEWLDGLSADDCRDAARVEWQRKIPLKVYPGMAREDRVLAIRAAQDNIGIGRMSRMWHELADFIEIGIDISGRLVVEVNKDEKTGATYHAIRIIWCDAIREGWKAPTLHYDATLSMDLVRSYFPNAELRAEIEAAAPHQHVTQFHGKTFSKGSMYNEKGVDKLWSWAKAKAMRSGGRWLVVVQKHVEDQIRARHKIPEFIDIAHHNAIAGIDKWKDVRGLIVAGRTAAPPVAVEQIAGALSGKHITPVRGQYPAETETITTKDGNAITVEADRHPDALAEQIRYAINETELIQIIGRARGVDRKAEGPVEIMVLGNGVLPVDIDALQEWITPSKDDELFAKSGIWLAASTDMALAHGVTHKTIERARQRTHPFPYKEYLYENGCHLRSAIYRRSGPGRKQQRVIWDQRLISDIRAFLADRIGPLVELSIDEPHDHAADQRIEVTNGTPASDYPTDHPYAGGIIPNELVAELDAIRRGAGLTLDQVAAHIGISRPQLSNARMGRFGLSIAAADRLMGWLSHPPPIRQMALL